MKSERQRQILEIVRTRDVYTQEELTVALKAAGFSATQATVSRDIRELRLTKIPTRDGQKYVVTAASDATADTLARIFRDGVISMDCAGNTIVLHTVPGMARAVALSMDNMGHPEIVGTVSGDDTVFCVVRNEDLVAPLMEKLG